MVRFNWYLPAIFVSSVLCFVLGYAMAPQPQSWIAEETKDYSCACWLGEGKHFECAEDPSTLPSFLSEHIGECVPLEELLPEMSHGL